MDDDTDAHFTVIEGGKAAPEGSPVKIEKRGGDQSKGKPTARMLGFIKSILAGENQSDAYRANYSTENMSDRSVWTAASQLFANPKVGPRITAGRAAQEVSTAHSGASLRAFVERNLMEMATEGETHAVRVRATELLGKSEKVGFFLDRSTDVPADSLTPEELETQLADKLKRAFG